MNEDVNPDVLLAEDMARFYADPLGFVMYAFPWDSNPAIQLVKLPARLRKKYNSEYGPDEWACEFLEEIGKEVAKRKFDGKKAVDALRAAVASGHGIGKSAITSWLVLWIMSTRPHCQGTVTANTSPQLETKTWAQVAKWKKLCITSHWFDISTGKGNMKMWHLAHKDSWFCSAQTCREENSESFAGQHAANSTSFYIFDESSAVSDKIKETAEGGLTDGEPMMFAFGNPTRATGWFRECFGRQKHRWITRRVDSRSVQITNKKQLQDWIDDYGIDSDFVKVRVKGEFPSSSSNQLIPSGLVEAASKRKIRQADYIFAPIILGVDPAWFGDDRSVICLRQGNASMILGIYRQVDNMTLGGLIDQFWTEWDADACFIDLGWGAGVIDFLRSIGRDPIAVPFGGKALKAEFKDKRTEMWCNMLEWLRQGGCIEANQELTDDLVAPEYYFNASGQKVLESKDDIKLRGLASPDLADALALTFAAPVYKKTTAERMGLSKGKTDFASNNYKKLR